MRKFHDAMLFGARTAGQQLPSNCHTEMDSFKNSFKKECKKNKEDGNADEQSADAIPFSLYGLICKWFFTSGNIFGWV